MSLEYSLSELHLAGQGPIAERIFDLIRRLGRDAEKVEGYSSKGPDSSICTATSKPTLRVHLNSGLAYSTTASRELERLHMKGSEKIFDNVRRHLVNGWIVGLDWQST